MVVGDNGIIRKAVQAKKITDSESLKEEINLVMVSREMEDDSSISLKQTLEKQISGDKTIEEIFGINDTYYVTRNGQTITVYEDGEIVSGRVSIWDGHTVECPEFKKENNIWNWYIYTSGQLKFLADFVNNGNQLTETQQNLVTEKGYNISDVTIVENETTVYLMNNLDLGARPGEGSTDEEKWENTSNESKKWTPIGIEKTFEGIFEGNNNIIRGVYVNELNGFIGLFGKCLRIQNLTIKNSYVKSNDYCVGGIAGTIYDDYIKNCHNINTIVVSIKSVEGYSYAGGVVGQLTGLSENCTNTGNITGTGRAVGGVVGVAYSKVKNCKNYGNVYSEGRCTGGIVGNCSSSSEVSNCINEGNITTIDENLGGVVGYLGKNAKMSNCTNNGNIKGTYSVGGIAGSATNIIDCTNTGNVRGDNVVGGIAGICRTIVKNCSNTGNIIGTGIPDSSSGTGVGGIVGTCVVAEGQDISFCYNSGDVKLTGENIADTYAGGISGYLGAVDSNPPAKEYKCYSKGKIVVINYPDRNGAIIGHMAVDATVTDCYYLSNVGVDKGVAAVTRNGDLDEKNAGTHATSVDLKSYEEFIAWIGNQ